LEVGLDLPREFDLMIAGLQETIRVQVKWQRGDYAGVAFRDAIAPADIDRLRMRERMKPRSR
jgi:hypothetical protein